MIAGQHWALLHRVHELTIQGKSKSRRMKLEGKSYQTAAAPFPDFLFSRNWKHERHVACPTCLGSSLDTHNTISVDTS
jgi:hypothetical protein